MAKEKKPRKKKKEPKDNTFAYTDAPSMTPSFEGMSKKEQKRLKKKEKEAESDRKREIRVMAKKTPGEVAFYKQLKVVEEEVEADYASRPTEKKKRGLAKLNDQLKNISLENLSRQIQGYGYDFVPMDYIKNVALVLIGMVAASMFFGLGWIEVAVLALVIIAVFPIITLAQAEVASNNDDFEQIIGYLEQMIISFKNNPKILLAMEETAEIVEGKMQEKVQEAINIIKNDAKSEDVYKRAFAVLENEYKCSRIRTLHRFIHTVESENSQNYAESLDNLYLDVKEWQKRTYKFQASLSATKNQLTILLAASIAIAGVFAYLMRTVENSVLDDSGNSLIIIIKSAPYQIATVIFFICFIALYTLVNTKINGSWLVNDLESPKDRETIKLMIQLALDDPETSTKNRRIAVAIMVVPILVAALLLKSVIMGTAAIIFGIFVLKVGEMGKKNKKKRVQEELKQEFPLWMRDVAISLKNRVVLRAIMDTEATAAYVMKPFIRMFLVNIERDPASIRPYMDFFGEYKAHELTTAIKTLYSIRTLSAEDSQRQVNDLIERNQDLLAESEKIRQENSIAGIGFIGMLPMLLMALLLMVYLVVMLMQFMALLGNAA